MSTDATTARPTTDLVLVVLRTADKPLTVSEIRARVRDDKGAAPHRSTVSSALQRLKIRSAAEYDIGNDGLTQRWRVVPETR